MIIVVKVEPGARREKVIVKSDASFEISVKEPAEGNRANDRVREILALHFGVTAKQIRFVSGARGRTKRFEVLE